LLDRGFFRSLFSRAAKAERELGFTGCGKTLVLYQGTTLVGPQTIENMSGFSPLGIAFLSGADVFPQTVYPLRHY
jgi:hypothetical protein